MKIPKRFKLHEAAAEDTPALRLNVVRVIGQHLIATDGVIVASVPVGGAAVTRQQREAGLVPALAPGEPLPQVLIDPRAWAEATRGSKGTGELRLEPNEHRAKAGDDKPATVFEPPRGPIGEQELPPAAEALEEARLAQGFEVCLDAEALARLQRALGSEEGVRLRFAVGSDGKCSSPLVAVEPVDGSPAFGAIMPIVREGHK